MEIFIKFINIRSILLRNKKPPRQRSRTSKRFRIEEIMAEKADKLYKSREKEFIISDLVLFEEKLSETNRKPEVVACKIYGMGEVLDRNAKEFSRRYKKWKDGYALRYSDRIEEIQLV